MDIGDKADGADILPDHIHQQAGAGVVGAVEAGHGVDGDLGGVREGCGAEVVVVQGFHADDGIQGGIIAHGLHPEPPSAVVIDLHGARAGQVKGQLQAEGRIQRITGQLGHFAPVGGRAGETDGDAVGVEGIGGGVVCRDASGRIVVCRDVEIAAQGQIAVGGDLGIDAEERVVAGRYRAGRSQEEGDFGRQREAGVFQGAGGVTQDGGGAKEADGNVGRPLDEAEAGFALVIGRRAAGDIGESDVVALLADDEPADLVVMRLQTAGDGHGQTAVILDDAGAPVSVAGERAAFQLDQRVVIDAGFDASAVQGVIRELAVANGGDKGAAGAQAFDPHAVQIVVADLVAVEIQVEIAVAGDQHAFAVAGDEVVVDGQVGDARPIDADAADFKGGKIREHFHDNGSAAVRVADREAADGGLVGHGDGGAHADAVNDGPDAGAERAAAVGGDEAAAAPEGGAVLQDNVFVVGLRGVEYVDVALSVHGVGGLLDRGPGAAGSPAAGGGDVAVDELNVVHEGHGAALGGASGGTGFAGERLVFEKLGGFEADLGIAHDHFGQAGGEVAGLGVPSGPGGGEGIAALGNGGEIERDADAGAGEPVAAGQFVVFIDAGIEEERGIEADFGAGLPAFGIGTVVAVEIVIAAEDAGFELFGFGREGQADAHFPVIAAEGLLVLFVGAGEGFRQQGAREDVILQDGVAGSIGILPVLGGSDGLAGGGFGFAGHDDLLVLGIVVIGAGVDPGAEDFNADAPLVVVGIAGVAVVIIGVGAEDEVVLVQQVAVPDADIEFLGIVIGDGGARIDEQEALSAGIPDGDQQVADAFGFGTARLEADGEFGGRPDGDRLRGGRRLLGLGFLFGLGRLDRRRGNGEKNDQNQRQRTAPASLHCNLLGSRTTHPERDRDRPPRVNRYPADRMKRR